MKFCMMSLLLWSLKMGKTDIEDYIDKEMKRIKHKIHLLQIPKSKLDQYKYLKDLEKILDNIEIGDE